MSIKIRANLDYLLDDKDLHFGTTKEKRLAIKTKCGQELVVFNDLVFAKKEPTKEEIEFVKEILKKQINEINENIKKLKKLEENKPELEKVFFSKKWNNNDVYHITVKSLEFDFNIKTKEVSNIDITVNKIEEIENKIKQIDTLIKKVTKRIEWQEKRDNVIEELNQGCNI